MDITIRQAQSEELATALSLFEEAALKLREKGINQWQHWLNPTPEYVDWAKKGFDNGEYFFIEKQGQLAGMYRLMYADEAYWGQQADAAAYVHSLVTKSGFEGQNIGTTALKLIEYDLIKKSIYHFRLDCKADNQPLCAYYIRQGFVPVRVQKMPHYSVQLFEKKLDKSVLQIF